MGAPARIPGVSPEPLEVFTLGVFLVKRGSRLLSDEADRANKMWELFQVILTVRGRLLTPQFLMEILWPDRDFPEPRLALKSLVHRLRTVIDGPAPPGARSRASHVLFTHGCYTWNPELDYRLDAGLFEQLYAQAKAASAGSPQKAAELYEAVLGLYQGEYLPECSRDWVESFRTRLRRLYVQAVLDLGGILSRAGAAGRLREICERALEVEPLEEDLHALYIQALLDEGKTNQARLHYREATGAMYRSLGIKPSPAMRRLYRAMEAGLEEDGARLASVEAALRSPMPDHRPLVCEPQLFRILYQLEERRAERYGTSSSLLAVRVSANSVREDGATFWRAAAALEEILARQLRKSDVICRWADAHFLVLLHQADAACARQVADRVTAAFRGRGWSGSVFLDVGMAPVAGLPGVPSR